MISKTFWQDLSKLLSTMFVSSLKLLRIAHNLTQKQVANLLGIPVYMYQRYEHSKAVMPDEYLKILSRRYGVLIDTLTSDNYDGLLYIS